jgi:hypothetical protein
VRTLKKENEITMAVHIEGLGLCEHCQALLSIENMPIEAMDAEWRCPKCNGPVSHKTFGFEETDKGWGKTKWVGPDQKWTPQRPDKSFDLGHWHIEVGHGRYFSF